MAQAAPNANAPAHGAQPVPAPPPTRSEIERKLSFKSAARPAAGSSTGESPKKNRKQPGYLSNPTSGNESDTSSIASSSYPTSASGYLPLAIPTSPTQPPTPGSGGLSSFTQKKGAVIGIAPGIAELDEDVDEEEEELDAEGEGSGSDDEVGNAAQGDLARGMEGERVLKSGYLWKKQERRKAWKKKWFVLRTGKLAYYKDDREYSLKRVIDLKSVHTAAPVTVKKHSFSFGIVTSKRTFLVKASSPDEMEDWVRAINAARRKLSEREEEDRAKREGKAVPVSQNQSTSAMPIPHPQRDRADTIETHQGTYSSTFTTGTTATSYSTSPPTTNTGYFAPRVPSASQPIAGSGLASPSLGSTGAAGFVPSSPMDTMNTLSAQMAKMGSMPRTPSGSYQPSSRSVSGQGPQTRRERSASSFSSAGDQAQQAAPMPASSDEDEAYFSDPNSAFGALGTGTGTGEMAVQYSQPGQQVVDPKKVILSGYLMKRSKGRGRKLWKKRWFFLTSQGLTYTKSHMDSRALRYIPLTSVLDALEIDSDDASLPSDEDSDDGPVMPTVTRQLSSLRQNRKDSFAASQGGSSSKEHADDNTFRIVTAKRVFVLCAPSEEDEIKWLAAFRALLNRERERSSGGGGGGVMSPVEQESRAAGHLSSMPLSPHPSHQPQHQHQQQHQQHEHQLQHQHQHQHLHPHQQSQQQQLHQHQHQYQQQQPLPYITTQPPTPASNPAGTIPLLGDALPTPSASTSQGPPVWSQDHVQQGGQQGGTGDDEQYGNGMDAQSQSQTGFGGRGRSATYTAQKAVADAVRRYRPGGGQGSQA